MHEEGVHSTESFLRYGRAGDDASEAFRLRSRAVRGPELPSATPVPSSLSFPRKGIRPRRREGQRGWVPGKARPRG